MMNPYDFFSEIYHEVYSVSRKEMAALALHLYFDPDLHPFVIERLRRTLPAAKATCFSAIFWAMAHRRNKSKKLSFRVNKSNFLTAQRQAWLIYIRDGGDPKLTNFFLY